MQDAVHDRVAQVEVAGGHIDLGPQDARAIRELALAHALEQVQVLGYRAVAIRAFDPRLGECAAVLADLVGAEVIDVRFALLDQADSPGIELVEVIGSEVQAVFPIEAQPADVVDDRIDVLDLFLGGIGVIEAQVVFAAVLLRHAKVQADGFGVTDVQVTVRLGWEAGMHPPAEPAAAVIGFDDLADEIGGSRGSRLECWLAHADRLILLI